MIEMLLIIPKAREDEYVDFTQDVSISGAVFLGWILSLKINN